MVNYFDYIVSKLTYDEMSVLGYLVDQEANALFKAVKKRTVQTEAKLTVATLRKAVEKLEAKRFLEIDNSAKEHKLYITEYGELALSKQLQEEEI